MRRFAKRISLLVTIVVAGCLAAGCGGAITSSISSVPSRTATISARPSVTAAPTAQPPTHSVTTVAPVAPSSVPVTPGASSGTSLTWLWVLLGVLVLVGLIAWITRSARRRSAAKAGQRSRLTDAYAKGAALHDAISVAEAPGGLAAADAGARWSDIQRRADDLAQTLYALGEAVPRDSADRAGIDDTLASLQAVRSAMDAERAPGGASLEQAEVVRSRLASFESSLRALRALDRELPCQTLWGARTRAGHLTWASILGGRALAPRLSVHGSVVRLAGAGLLTQGELLRGAVCGNATARVPRPPAALRRTPPPAGPGRVHPALQRAPTAPVAGTKTSAARARPGGRYDRPDHAQAGRPRPDQRAPQSGLRGGRPCRHRRTA